MKKILFAVVCFLAINSVFAQVVAECVDGQVWVQFKPSAIKQISKENPRDIPLSKINFLNNLLAKYEVTKVFKPFYQANDDAKLPYVLQIDFNKKTKVEDLIKDLKEINGVDYAEKVPAMSTHTVPNDPSYAAQQSAYMNQILAPTAWDVYFNANSSTRVAIVDNAVRWNHVDLVANTFTNTIETAGIAGVDDDGNGYIDDFNGFDVSSDFDNNANPSNNAMDHGTHCAGIAGARNNNGIGIGSIGWNIKIIPVKCTSNGGNVNSVENAYQGIVYAAKMGARVISCSFGGGTFSQVAQDVITYAWTKGSIIIASAGNSGNNSLNYPGAYANVYCVASCATPGNVKSGFSNYGQVGNAWVDITAPGENIYSTVPTGGNSYTQYSGTSMATPLVAGLAGLMLSYVPLMTQQNVLNCISSSAANIYTVVGNGTYSVNNQLGAGRINATAAMNCAGAYLLAAPVANFYSLIKNTCPNTPVTFQDSSLYVYNPAVWSWSFQAGTPATSSASMPVVQWSAPGTYSVRMTLTTPNGSNTVTKLSYITVSNPIALPLNEGFQTLPFLPANWTAVNIDNDNVYWSRATGVGGFGTSTACALFDNAGLDAAGARDEMRTPRYNCNNVVSARLRFDVAYKVLNNIESDTLKIKGSTNCGTSWTTLYTKGGATLATAPLTPTAYPLWVPLPNQWRRDTIDVTGLIAGQSNVMFSFINHGHYGQGTYLDNINLFFPAPTTTFAVPPPVCAGNSVTYTNNTVGAASYSWSFQGGTPATSTATNPVVTYSAGGIFTTTLSAFNGTTIATITKTISINPTPSITANNQTICAGGQATINASGAATYTWSNGFVGNPLLISPPSNTVLTITASSLGCIGTKTVSVTIGSQLAVFITPVFTVACSGISNTLTASGAVNYTWNGGSNASSIVVSPTINTTYSITGSNGACTGTTVLTVTVMPTPTMAVNFAPSPSICLGQTASLTASGSYTQFTWVTPTVVANSITVNPIVNTSYTVTANGNGGCTTSTVVNVTIKPLPGAVVTTTDASCAGCPDGEAVVTVTSGVGPYTYQWLPVGGTGSFVSGFTDGCYSVNVTGSGCVSQFTMCIGFSTKAPSITNSFKGLQIFPNPAHNYVVVDFQGANFNFSLYNNLGQLIVEKNNNHNMAYIEFEKLANGMYTIVVENGNEKVRKKLIIE